MNQIPFNPETEAIARNIIWFESPKEALADPVRFIAYAMVWASHEGRKVIRQYVNDDDFREALECPSHYIF